MKLLIVNGPNLNLLGRREPETYGDATLDAIEADLTRTFPDVSFDFFQSNGEGALIDRLQAADDEGFDGVVLNPGGYAHTSVALRDAVAAIAVPVVEVHISNVYAREPLRHHSYVSAVCTGQITGFGAKGYHMAVWYFVQSTAGS